MAEEQAPEFQATPAGGVFVSYASQDALVAHSIVETLEAQGTKCWIAPRDVTPGAHYADEIIGAISGAKALILVLSDSALASKHVSKEVERASSKGRPIIALRTGIAPLTPALEYFLSESQWIEAPSGNFALALTKLVTAVQRLSHPVAEAKPGAATALHGSAFIGAATRSGARRFKTSTAKLATLVVIVAAALTYCAVQKFQISEHATRGAAAITADAIATVPEKSIAVIPFTDMSEKKNQEYMSDGIAEELLTLLAQAPGLKVIARTSSFSFKGKDVDIATIAKKLHVAHVLEGSVRKSGNSIRVTAQLIRTADSTHLWSEAYDRPLNDIFVVQEEIASAIAQALQIRLAGGELSRRKGGTQNLEAYQLCLRAWSALGHTTQSSLDSATAYAEQAIKLDPSYGMAWFVLANSYGLKADNGMLPATQGYERMRQLAQRALQVSPDLAEAHAELQYVYQTLDWDWAAAEAEQQQALAIDPTNPLVLNMAGKLSATLGRWNEAESQFRTALVRDPLNIYVIWNLGNSYYLAGRFDQSEGMYRQLLRLAPDFGWTRPYLSKTLLAQGKPEAALALVQGVIDKGDRLLYLPIMLQAVGRKTEADEALRAQIAHWADTGAYYVAQAYAYRGEKDFALKWLERAYKQKDASLVEIVGEPLFKGMADDPRYKAFLRKMKLPE